MAPTGRLPTPGRVSSVVVACIWYWLSFSAWPTGSGGASQTFDQLKPFACGNAVEAHFGRTTREFDGCQDAAIRFRSNVLFQGCFRLPPLDENKGAFRGLLLVNVKSCATRLSHDWPFDGSQYLEHIGAPVG
jgi:hypothetical protein